MATYLWGGLADQRCYLYLVGHDLGHPKELDRGSEEDCASHLSPRCHQVRAGQGPLGRHLPPPERRILNGYLVLT